MAEDRKLRIAYLIPEWPGQTHIWMWREICNLRELGAEVIVYATRPPPARDHARHAFAEQAAKDTRYLCPRRPLVLALDVLATIVQHPLGTIRSLAQAIRLPLTTKPGWRAALPMVFAAAEMAAMVQRDGIKHVHVASAARCALIAMFLKNMIGMPFSLTINANLEWWGGAMRQKLGAADFVIAIAAWMRAKIIELVPLLGGDRVLLAPVGVDTRHWKPVDRTWPAPGETLRLVSVGRLHPSKGHDTAIRAIARLLTDGQNVHLRILGGGPDQPRLEALIRELQLQGAVELLGSVDEDTVRRELGTSHIFILASHAEPLGVVYMEAMATAIPTIGTRAGGVTEIITDGHTGYLVPPHDERALADCVVLIAKNAETATVVGQAGRRSIEKNFDSMLGAKVLFDKLNDLHGTRAFNRARQYQTIS